MKRILLFLLFSGRLYECDGQVSKRKFVIITYELDGHGKWLDFINDSNCVYSTGSVSWGTTSDTLNYKNYNDTIVLTSRQTSELILKLTLKKISHHKFTNEKNNKTYRRQYFCQTNRNRFGRILLLKPL